MLKLKRTHLLQVNWKIGGTVHRACPESKGHISAYHCSRTSMCRKMTLRQWSLHVNSSVQRVSLSWERMCWLVWVYYVYLWYLELQFFCTQGLGGGLSVGLPDRHCKNIKTEKVTFFSGISYDLEKTLTKGTCMYLLWVSMAANEWGCQIPLFWCRSANQLCLVADAQPQWYHIWKYLVAHCYRMSQAVMGCHRPQDITRCHNLSQDVTEYQGLSQDATGCHEIPQAGMRCHRLSWDATGHHGMSQAVIGCHRLSNGHWNGWILPCKNTFYDNIQERWRWQATLNCSLSTNDRPHWTVLCSMQPWSFLDPQGAAQFIY